MAGCGKTLGSNTAKKATSRSSKAGLQFPVDLSPVSSRPENISSVLASLVGNAARDNKKTRIVSRHIRLVMRNDEELNNA
ncbi:hypothetical protein AAZX31_13G011700 [Glycine max]